VAVHAWPGWAAVPFLTPATAQVLGVVTGSLVLTLVVQALDALVDRPRLRAAGDVATSASGIVVTLRLLQLAVAFAEAALPGRGRGPHPRGPHPAERRRQHHRARATPTAPASARTRGAVRLSAGGRW
jgi:hypothetical protein